VAWTLIDDPTRVLRGIGIQIPSGCGNAHSYVIPDGPDGLDSSNLSFLPLVAGIENEIVEFWVDLPDKKY